ncbi:MAG: tRNA (adenosine(37)-N6)-threonylcarbamoyltransferase complex ATPase subunit type 1 TsaE [Clostridium sp.]|nr:tRNA (adenosine(37)-N6)-threonylcarbamoyltransferase complex ATPase subunit type 1 TsaE [Clostridium sp.]MCM1547976.1 tRNA (adenosine(37)-N6)-threonylcarbamoyltransferase complex ATPase subunit type 1 TsaE [Ruminococcus sp.]
MKIITGSPEETIAFAEKIGSMLRKGDMIAYRGGLGVGKTTFTRGLAKGLGLKDEVTSPTFAIVNEYRGEINLYHFDMYRISDPFELDATGFYDYPQEKSVFAIEWSENISDIFDEKTIYITIERIDDDTRKITVEGDERFADDRD